MKFIGIIPARWASSRFPGKPLALIGGVTMIERVYRQASKALDEVIVATDDVRILQAVEQFGGKAVMTSTAHRSGTDRCAEAYRLSGSTADVVVNIQGDEPFIAPEQIDTVCSCFRSDPSTSIATLARPFDPALGFEALFDSNRVKVTFDDNGNALYFSRAIIPYIRNYPWQEWLDHHTFYLHVGMYAYRAEVLQQLTALPQSSLELAESLEQLRWLQSGYSIRVGITHLPTVGIDTPADLDNAIRLLDTLK